MIFYGCELKSIFEVTGEIVLVSVSARGPTGFRAASQRLLTVVQHLLFKS